ncbi:GNAT family N-acetyltransferase [Novipirellula caenicola]|uniref:N-acetyltransferase domain-containing protein n=1 Tax=Novipirellula caenicola TaxID=1536901 RepID=A0ABP9VR02_9BACT
MSNSAWTVEPFERKSHDRTGFDCGVEVLNDWLATKISQYEKRDLARTYVLVEDGSVTIRGYYALSNHTVVFEALPDDQAKGLPQIDIPVVLLGRLAVDKNAHGEGLGEFLLMDALRRAEYLAARIGIQAVEVEAINDHAKQFYLKYGFTPLEDDPQNLFLPVKVIRKLRLPSL